MPLKPLLNLPVAIIPGKSIPLGGKLALSKSGTLRLLLLPLSARESPNTKSGTVAPAPVRTVRMERMPMAKKLEGDAMFGFGFGRSKHELI